MRESYDILKANILKTNIIRIVLIFFVLVCLYFIISTGQILLKTDERLYDFAELKRLNEELYLQIDLQNIHTTIENTENSINKINTLMDKISSNFVITKLFYNVEHVELLEKLKNRLKTRN